MSDLVYLVVDPTDKSLYKVMVKTPTGEFVQKQIKIPDIFMGDGKVRALLQWLTDELSELMCYSRQISP